MDLLSIFRSCVTGMIPVTLITFSGAYLTHIKVFNKESNDLISKSCAKFFFVILPIAVIPKAIDFDSFLELWPLFIITLFFIIIGIILSYFLLYIIKPPLQFRLSTISVLVFSNAGNVPLLIMKGICASYGPLSGNGNCDKSGGYVALIICICNVIIWSVCIALIKLDKISSQKHTELQNLTENDDVSEEIPFKTLILRGLISPVPIASILGLISGFIPGFNWLFVTKSSPLYSVYDSLFIVAYIGVVISQMIIGSNLLMIEKSEIILSKFYLILTTLTKNVIYPCVFLLFTVIFWNLGVYGDDKVMAYIIFIAQASPVASTVIIQCQILNTGVKECAVVFLWQYLSAPFTLTIFTYIFFLLI